MKTSEEVHARRTERWRFAMDEKRVVDWMVVSGDVRGRGRDGLGGGGRKKAPQGRAKSDGGSAVDPAAQTPSEMVRAGQCGEEDAGRVGGGEEWMDRTLFQVREISEIRGYYRRRKGDRV